MKKERIIFGVLLVLGTPSFASAAEKCDRACLIALMDEYLAAVVKHSPTGVPIASDAKLVENLKQTPYEAVGYAAKHGIKSGRE